MQGWGWRVGRRRRRQPCALQISAAQRRLSKLPPGPGRLNPPVTLQSRTAFLGGKKLAIMLWSGTAVVITRRLLCKQRSAAALLLLLQQEPLLVYAAASEPATPVRRMVSTGP